MRLMSCEKRQAEEDAMAAFALDRLAEVSDRVKRVKRSPIANVDALHNLVTFSQYYNDDFHSESDTDDDNEGGGRGEAMASDYSTGKDVDSEESPPIELEIQDIRVTKAGRASSRSGRAPRRNGKPSKQKSATHCSTRHGAPSKRLTQGLHDLSQCVTALLHDNDVNGDHNSPTLESIQDDPNGAVDDMSVSLTAFRHIMDSIRSTASNELQPIVKPSLEQVWETAQKMSRQEARMNLACWRNAAGELRVQLQNTLATSDPTSTSDNNHRALLERCLDFVSSVSLCNLVRDESTDIRNLAVQESSDHLCRGIHQHNSQRFESLTVEARELANAMRRDAPDHEESSPPSSPLHVAVRPAKRTAPAASATGCNVCGDETSSSDVLMSCDNNCGKLYHAACLELPGPPEEGSWYCPDCMESLGLSGDGQVFLCAALHCKRISVTRYCAVHSCRFKGCNFRLRGRGYCRRHDTHQKRSMASA